MAKLQLHLAEEVRRELPDDQLAAVLDGQAVPPVYECIVCRKPGDARTRPTNAVLWVGGQTAQGLPAAMLTLVHGGPRACAPSEVRLVDEWERMPPAEDHPAGEPDSFTLADVLQTADGSRWATLTLQPATTIRSMLGGQILDLGLEALVGQGWAAGLAQVPVLAGWYMELHAGRFARIRDHDDQEWWVAPDPDDPALPDWWQQAARTHGHVLVLVLPPGAITDTSDYHQTIATLAGRRELAAAKLALAGTFSDI